MANPATIVGAPATSALNTFGGASSLNAALPTGITSGELLILVVGSASSTAAITPNTPAGWTLIRSAEYDTGSGSVTAFCVFRKAATGSEGSTVTVTTPGTTLALNSLAFRVSGHDPTTPIDVSASTNNTGVLPSVTVTAGKVSSLIVGGTLYQFPTTAPTTPTGWTALGGVIETNWGFSNYATYKTVASAGATGTATYITGTQAAISWTMAIAPQPAQLIGHNAITQTPVLSAPAVTQTITTPTKITQTPVLRQHTVAQALSTVVLRQTPTLTTGSLVSSNVTVPGPAPISQPPVVYTPAISAPGTEQQIVTPVAIAQTPTLATPAAADNAFALRGTGSTLRGPRGLRGTIVLTGGGLTVAALIGSPTKITQTPSLYSPVVSQRVAHVTITQTPALYEPTVSGVVDFLAGFILPWGTSRRWNAWVEFLVAGDIVISSRDGDFALASGKVSEDITRAITRDVSISLTFPGDTGALSQHVPTEIGDLLDANTNTRMRVWAGFYGEEECLGTFDVTSTSVKETSGGATIDIQGMSFERIVQKAGFWQVESADDGSSIPVVIADLIHEALPEVQILTESTSATTPGVSWKPGDDRLTKVGDLLVAAGMEGHFDRDNRYIMRKAPTINDFGLAQADWELTDGYNATIATLNAVTRTFSDDNAYNGVVIEGGSHQADNTEPVLYSLWNSDPASPLFYDPANPTASRVGPRPKYIRSESVATQSDAVVVAQAELAKVLMWSDMLEVEVPAHAGITIGQYARATSSALGVDDIYRIARVDIDLHGAPNRLAIQRQQRV